MLGAVLVGFRRLAVRLLWVPTSNVQALSALPWHQRGVGKPDAATCRTRRASRALVLVWVRYDVEEGERDAQLERTLADLRPNSLQPA